MNPPYPSDGFWILTGLAAAIVITWIGIGLTMALYLWIDRKREAGRKMMKVYAARFCDGVEGGVIFCCETEEELRGYCIKRFGAFDDSKADWVEMRRAGK